MTSPNELEAEQLVGHEFNDDDDRAQAVVEMTRLGAREAIRTVGDGCYAKLPEDGSPALVCVRVEGQEARSPIGSGDAFLAGYRAARYTGRERLDALRYAVACGAESTRHFGAGVIDPGQVERLLPEVEVERLELGRRSAKVKPGRLPLFSASRGGKLVVWARLDRGARGSASRM